MLSKLIDSVKADDEVSNDATLITSIKELGVPLRMVAFDAPLTLPQCVPCRKECPGTSKCKEPHISWFWEHFRSSKKEKRTTRLFTPYTQRPVEAYLNNQLEEAFHPSDALGANTAPLTARMNFLLRHLKEIDCVEVFPKLSLWRIGRALKITKRHLRFHKHSVEGDKSRLVLLNTLSENGILFLYHADLVRLVAHGNAFDSLICALTAFLKHRNLTEPRPSGFPINEAWIEFPTVNCF